mmetsp:Transcript_27249/g.63729  ORF Transcript_27249/g.63729 Transcript_27249/m.63729 type:complete len:661 (-) Transcript_27249:1601-3583(-)
MVVVHEATDLGREALTVLVRADGRQTVERLAEVGVDGRLGDGVEPLHFAVRLAEVVDCAHVNVGERDDGRDEDGRSPDHDDTNEEDVSNNPQEHLDRLGQRHVHLVDVTREAVDDAAERGGVEPAHRGAEHIGEEHVVHRVGRADADYGEAHRTDHAEEPDGNGHGGVNAEVETDRVGLELLAVDAGGVGGSLLLLPALEVFLVKVVGPVCDPVAVDLVHDLLHDQRGDHRDEEALGARLRHVGRVGVASNGALLTVLFLAQLALRLLELVGLGLLRGVHRRAPATRTLGRALGTLGAARLLSLLGLVGRLRVHAQGGRVVVNLPLLDVVLHAELFHHVAEVELRVHQLLESALLRDALVLAQHNDAVAALEAPELVGHEQARLTAQLLQDELVEDPVADLGVERAERVVEDERVGLRVDRACDRNARLLPTGQVDPALADLGRVVVGQRLEVVLEAARLDRAPVLLLVPLAAEDDVLAEGLVKDPRRLRDVRDATLHGHLAAPLFELAQERRAERRLTRAHLAHHGHKLALAHAQVDVVQDHRRLGWLTIVAFDRALLGDLERLLRRVVDCLFGRATLHLLLVLGLMLKLLDLLLLRGLLRLLLRIFLRLFLLHRGGPRERAALDLHHRLPFRFLALARGLFGQLHAARAVGSLGARRA